MAKIVQKFGGTSVADLERMRHAAQIVVNAANQGDEVLTVVSAMGDTTDKLIALAEKITPSPSARELDMLLATGEQQSVALMSMAIQELGGQARSFTGAQAGILTEGKHGCAKIEEIQADRIQACMNRGEIPVVAGFQGMTANHELTTLGRGGSDTTAVALATAIGADRCDIYTDVDGIYSCDPNLVENAIRLPGISYDEMFEMANSGAKVMNDRAVALAKESGIPIQVRSTFKPEDRGTLISGHDYVPDYPICGITLDMNQVCFNWRMAVNSEQEKKLDGVASLFLRLNELNISTDMIMLLAREDEPVQELFFTVHQNSSARVQSIIEGNTIESKLNIDDRLARISVISRRLNGRPEIVASAFDSLNKVDIPVQMVATGDLRFSLLIPKTHARRALQTIHEHCRPGIIG